MKDYQRLVTFYEVREEALGSFDVKDYYDATLRAIEYATRQIEEYLQRDLIVRERLDLSRNIDLEYDHSVSTDSTSFYSFYTGDWPVLEVISVEPDTYTLQVHPDNRRLYTGFDNFDYAVRRVKYYAGYRRRDQVLSGAESTETTLPAGDGEPLDGLSTLPPVLPAEIRSTCIRIVLHRLKAMHGEGIGLGERERTVSGGQTVRTASVDDGFVDRELSALDKHRSLAW